MGVGYRDSVLYMKPTLTSDREAIPPHTRIGRFSVLFCVIRLDELKNIYKFIFVH